jgi:hypothetical protein
MIYPSTIEGGAPLSLADKIGALPGLGEVWNYGPWWATLIALMFGWLAMNAIAMLIECRILWPSEQYWSFYYGDLVLPLGIGLIAYMAEDLHGNWYRASWFQWLALGLGLTGGLGQVALEIKNRQYTRQQFLSPTKIWHNLILWPVMAYWLISGGLAVMFSSPGHELAKSLLGACIGLWVAFSVYDAKFIRPRAHVNFSWLDWFAHADQPYRQNSNPPRW